MPILKLLIFSLMSFLAIFLLMLIIKRSVKNEKKYDIFFIISAILTVLIHYSELIVKFKNGDYFIEDNLFLPVYPCNVMMWINLILCFLMIKKGKAFDLLASFSLYAGTMCGIIGLCFNANYLNNPNLADYGILKGLLSHVTLIFSSLYLGLFGYVKVKTFNNLKGLLLGAVIFFLCSVGSDYILGKMGREAVNGMFIKPLEGHPFVNFFTISLLGLVLYLIITSVYEAICYKEDAWFRNVRKENENERYID